MVAFADIHTIQSISIHDKSTRANFSHERGAIAVHIVRRTYKAEAERLRREVARTVLLHGVHTTHEERSLFGVHEVRVQRREMLRMRGHPHRVARIGSRARVQVHAARRRIVMTVVVGGQQCTRYLFAGVQVREYVLRVNEAAWRSARVHGATEHLGDAFSAILTPRRAQLTRF